MRRGADQYRHGEQKKDEASMMDAVLLFVVVPVAGLVAYFAFNIDAVIVAIKNDKPFLMLSNESGEPR